MIAAYPDINGFVGEAERATTAREDASDAMRAMLSTVEALAILCDRHGGDSGDDAGLIEDWAAEAERLCEKVRTALGEPRIVRHGVLAPAEMAR